jgi:hypothetical protein|tara:strand:- start:233 stop:619 length:387 start_codon:yes stop_codon:yes gene_type:complete
MDRTITVAPSSTIAPTFSQIVGKWIEFDNEIQELQEKIKEVRDKKQRTSKYIIDTLREKNKEHVVMDIPNGTLRVQDRKEYSGMTFQYVEKCLHSLIPDKEQRDFVLQYLRDNRETKVISELKRQMKK